MSSLPAPGTGYFVSPDDGPGPGVLLLPSAWGLSAAMKERADELADAGFTVLVPDLSDGFVAESEASALANLRAADINVVASLAQSSLRLLRNATRTPTDPAGLVGFGSGASWAFWLSERLGPTCSAVVAYYGTQSITFDESQSTYLLHVGDDDAQISDDDLATLGLNLQLARRPYRLERHAGAAHGFAEPDHPAFDPAVEAVAWRQTLEFLAAALRP